MKQETASIYIRKADQKTVQFLKETTRVPIAEFMHEFLSALQEVFDSLPNCDRITIASYSDVKGKPKRVTVFIAPILAGSLQFEPTNMMESVDETLANEAIKKDIEKKVTKQ